jgi:hypothetical protein
MHRKLGVFTIVIGIIFGFLPACSDDSQDARTGCPVSPLNNPELCPAPGLYIGANDTGPTARHSFSATARTLGTYYFYWYDVYTGEHMFNPDGSDALKDHPSSWPEMDSPPFSYTDPAWHRKELLDMMDAGIDFVLPVYWGRPGYYSDFSFIGLEALVEACDQLVTEGYDPPKIGMFLDTNTITWENLFEIPTPWVDDCKKLGFDLTTREGKLLFYGAVRDFYSMVPCRYRLRFEGRCVAWLFAAHYACDYDETLTGFIDEHFRADFQEPGIFMVKETTWRDLPADMEYAWGAAVKGFIHLDVMTIGPGIDTTIIGWLPCNQPIVVDRLGGIRYKTAWSHVQYPGIVVIETWNEFHEATDICESYEFGRQYIDITKKAATRWKSGIQ